MSTTLNPSSLTKIAQNLYTVHQGCLCHTKGFWLSIGHVKSVIEFWSFAWMSAAPTTFKKWNTIQGKPPTRLATPEAFTLSTFQCSMWHLQNTHNFQMSSIPFMQTLKARTITHQQKILTARCPYDHSLKCQYQRNLQEGETAKHILCRWHTCPSTKDLHRPTGWSAQEYLHSHFCRLGLPTASKWPLSYLCTRSIMTCLDDGQ